MTLVEWIIAIGAFMIAIVLMIMGIRSFKHRGFLFNNAYIYASKAEREKLDKGLYYRQSGIVFLLLSIVFVVIGISIILHDSRINLLEIPFILGAVIYAVISSIRIHKNQK